MGGTALEHPLVRGYLRELDAAMRGLPAAQARELKEQISAHLDDTIWPDADDEEVAATLSRLGSPADLAAEAWAASDTSGPQFRPGSWRMRWRLAAVIAVPMVAAVALCAIQISGKASNDMAASRNQHLAQLSVAVVRLSQDLEDERDLSAAYAGARPQAGPVPLALTNARSATSAAAASVRTDAAGIGAGYQAGVVQARNSLLTTITDLGGIRRLVSQTAFPAGDVIRAYTEVIETADTLSAAAADATSDASLQTSATALAALLRMESEQSVQRAILYDALSAQPPVLDLMDLTSLRDSRALEEADLVAFTSSGGKTEQRLFAETEAGPAVDNAAVQEAQAEQEAAASPRAPLTRNPGLDAALWYGNTNTTIGDTRKVADQLARQITDRANTLKANAAKSLLLTSSAALVLLLVLLISAVLAHSLSKLHPARRPR